MKQAILFTVVLILISTVVFSQSRPIVKVHAYSQVVLPGTIRSSPIEEGGAEVQAKSNQKINYLIYAEHLTKARFTITAMWIDGKQYKVKADSIAETPVENKIPDPYNKAKNTTLVPATTNKVLLLSAGSQIVTTKKPSVTLQKQLSKAELIIVYKWNGKYWYFTVPKITVLDPVASV
jgi:hypothetical protein